MHAWEQIQGTIDYLEEHLGEEVNITNLAAIAALSPFYYQRLFRRLVKKPVGEYVKLRRMARAAQLLLEEDGRILDLALHLGFSSHEHFTRTFKTTFGITPEQYRRHPQALNRMTKPNLLLNYTLVDEGVPLVTDGIVLEFTRRQVAEPQAYAGLSQRMPNQFVSGLGVSSGVDPLFSLWQEFHEKKETVYKLGQEEEVGVSFPSPEEGWFTYFAGAKQHEGAAPTQGERWVLLAGDYLVCSFEAENFEALVMDALYKAQQYSYGVWLPGHQLRTEPFCMERYGNHSADTTAMEIWMKLL